jgi:hypothetical protein
VVEKREGEGRLVILEKEKGAVGNLMTFVHPKREEGKEVLRYGTGRGAAQI